MNGIISRNETRSAVQSQWQKIFFYGATAKIQPVNILEDGPAQIISRVIYMDDGHTGRRI